MPNEIDEMRADQARRGRLIAMVAIGVIGVWAVLSTYAGVMWLIKDNGISPLFALSAWGGIGCFVVALRANPEPHEGHEVHGLGATLMWMVLGMAIVLGAPSILFNTGLAG